MSKRTRAETQELVAPAAVPEDELDPPAETRRTRSGRRIRTPAALLGSEISVRTPSRRTRRSVVQEQPEPEEKETGEQEPEKLPEETPEETPAETPTQTPADPEPSADPELAAQPQIDAAPADTDETPVSGGGDGAQPRPDPDPVETAPASSESVPMKKPCPAPTVKQTPAVPLGKPKSGRVWKDRSKQRFSALVRDKPLCTSWEKKMQAKREKDLVKQYALQLKEEKAKQKEDKRKRREDNLKRREENERKSEIVQVIRNTAKIKRMKKKQLRKIEKRDTLALLQKSQNQNVKTKARTNNKRDST
ncbi:coiled-coil domain-containing protein 86-like [Salarias fasciatus]|uniref:Coiled-coil domain-containing protein 86 n=1 Tax=Salarias fasciatus TaxID=181472 RepID=A0A672H252_SALFA|nr:coiled-coil domain-containing protein 86-like [Salarias fasciatus]